MDSVPKVAILILLTSLVSFCVGNINIKYISTKLSQDVDALKNEELGVPFIEKLFGSFKYSTSNVNTITTNIKSMVQKLENKINSIFSVMENSTKILDILISKRADISSVVLPCVKEKNNALEVLVNSNLINNNSINEFFGPNYILYQMRKNITSLSNALKQQYFLSEKDIKTTQYSPLSECSGHDEAIVWKNFMARSKYVRKNIVLLLDHGGSLSKRQLQIAKSIGKEILSSLNKNDRIALIAVASDCSYPERECPDGKNVKQNIYLQEVKTSYLLLLSSFIDSLARGSGATNHVIGMQKALEVVSNTPDFNKDDVFMIIYISRGLLSSLTEARSVLKIIAQHTAVVAFPIFIHTCAVIDELKPVMYETHFLRDIADQNFTKYNISYTHNHFRNPGYMLTVNKTDDIGFVINRFFSVFNTNFLFNIDRQISLPHWDPQSGGKFYNK